MGVEGMMSDSFIWHTFRGLVLAINRMMEDMGGDADVLAIYITEAHDLDEWHIGSHHSYSQHTSLAERARIVAYFLSHSSYLCPMLLDPVGTGGEDNPFETAYSHWPIRFYVLYTGKVKYTASSVNWSIHADEQIQLIYMHFINARNIWVCIITSDFYNIFRMFTLRHINYVYNFFLIYINIHFHHIFVLLRKVYIA